MSRGSVALRQPLAPKVAEKGLRLTEAYHDRLVFVCSGPEPDQSGAEESVVVGYCARYSECGRFARGPWVERDSLDHTRVAGHADLGPESLQLTLNGLAAEKDYVVQVAAVAPAGRGPWSAQSQRARTWRLAPSLTCPTLLYRTHTALLLGWSRAPKESLPHQDEEIMEFALTVTPPESSGLEAREISTQFRRAADLAAAWHEMSEALRVGQKDCRTVSGGIPEGVLHEDPSVTVEFVAAVLDLSPGSSFSAAVHAISSVGRGHASPESAKLQTLAAAPLVGKLFVDDVQHDQFQISWEHPAGPSQQLRVACEQLGLGDSLEELEIRGYSVRSAPWTSWRRLQWSEPTYVEVETLLCLDTGRSCYTVEDLEPEHRYAVEVKVHTARGSGEWRRHGEQPVCTAIVAAPPPAPELVYATSRTLTFSFASVEDVAAYEVRWFTGWGRASEPVRFDAQSLAVGITADSRWVVNMNHLRSATKYVLQLRGVTKTGGFTKWSAKSEAMCTLMGSLDAEPELGVGVNDETPTLGAVCQTKLSSKPTPSTGAESVEDFSQKLETVLSFTVYHAMAGVRMPSVNIPSVAERAEELLRQHMGNCDSAVAEACRISDDGTLRTKLPDFLIQQVPVVGCSMVLLRELWRNIRQCALIAQLYGHNTASAETQALLLTCLIPSGSASTPATQNSMVGSAALLVSRALARETFVRATGLKSAGSVVEMLEIAGGLLKSNSEESQPAASGSPVSSDEGPDVVTRSRSFSSADDEEKSTPARMAEVVFRPQNIEEQPVVMLALLVLWLLPILVSVARFMARMLAKRIQMELPVATVVIAMLSTQVAGSMAVLQVQQNLESFLCVPATFVFTLHAMLPGISVFMAMRSLLQGASEAPYFALLGAFNLASGYLRWADDLSDEAAVQQWPSPPAAHWRPHVRKARRLLWIVLISDFVAEELLGRVCRLHSFRVLGPPRADAHATLVEYRTLSFAMGLVAAWSQAKLLELLQHRTVLLRLLGAQKALYAGLSLLLMGAFAVVQQNRTVQFLHEVSPTPLMCCAVLWIRRFGAIAGALIPPLFYALLWPQCLGALPVDLLVPVAVLSGVLLGYLLCHSFMALWLEKKEHLESDCRVLQLFPRMSSQAQHKAAVVMRMAIKRGAEATTNTAVNWVASRVVRTGANYVGRVLTRSRA